MKKETKQLSRKTITIIAIVCMVSLIGGLFLGLSMKKDNHSKLMSYEDAKEESQRLAKEAQEKAEKTRQQLNDFQNKESTKDEKIKQEIEAELEKKIKSELYKQYEKLSQKEKEKIDAIPREEEVPIEVLDDIIEDQKEIEVPSKYSLQDVIDIQVEDQGSRGLCWAFASMKSLETHLALHENKNYDFSEQHVNYLISNLLYPDGIRMIDGGGSFDAFKKYLMLSGPVLEETVPYEKDYNEKEYSTFIDMEPVKVVTETVEFPSVGKDPTLSSPETMISDEELVKFRETVKRHIMQNGSVYATINAYAYNLEDSRYTFQSKDSVWPKMSNHAISIVGWDDDFPKENFRDGDIMPEHDGAYIALNSWGNTYIDDQGRPSGYFYISYDDIFVETNMAGIISTEINDTTAVELDKIKSKSIKNEIYRRYYYGLKEKDKKQYVTKLLFSEINTLIVEGEKGFDLNELSFLTDLHSLTINDSEIKSIDNLPKLDNLYSISLNNNDIENIDILANYPKLMNIYVTNNKIKDVSKLKDLPISMLDLSGNKEVTGYGQVKTQYWLKLDNIETKGIEELSYAPQIISLRNNQLENLANIPTTVSNLYIANNNISDLSILGNFSNLRNLDISQNPITDLSVFKGQNNNNNNELVESGGEYNTNKGIAITFKDSELTDITMFNDLDIRYIDLSGNKISNIDGFSPSESVKDLILDNNEIKDVSNLNSKNISRISLSGNKNIKGYGKLKVEELQLDKCNITELETLSDGLKRLYIDNNSLKDISPLSSAKSLASLSINNNKETISGTLESDISTLSIKNTKFSNGFKWNCNNLNNVSTDDLKFDRAIVKESGTIAYTEITIKPEEFSELSDKDHLIYCFNCNMTIKYNLTNNLIKIADIPLVVESNFNELNIATKTDNVAISRDRKNYIMLDPSITEIKENIYLSNGDTGSYFNVTIELNKSLDLFSSIGELFRNMIHTVREMI